MLKSLIKAVKRFKGIPEQVSDTIRDTNCISPEHRTTEILYHATTHAIPLAGTGFGLKLSGSEGIGDTRGDTRGRPAIWFTRDLYAANQAARSLKEAVMITKGKLTLHHIRDWAKGEGILDKVEAFFYGVYEVSGDSMLDLFNYYQTYLAYSKRHDPLFFGVSEAVLNKWKHINESNIGVVAVGVNMANPHIKRLISRQEYRVPPEAVVEIIKVIR